MKSSLAILVLVIATCPGLLINPVHAQFVDDTPDSPEESAPAPPGIEPVIPEVGDTFDPQVHQAMFEAPVPGTKAGDIIQVMATGFVLHERLLRPAQVGVSSTPAS